MRMNVPSPMLTPTTLPLTPGETASATAEVTAALGARTAPPVALTPETAKASIAAMLGDKAQVAKFNSGSDPELNAAMDAAHRAIVGPASDPAADPLFAAGVAEMMGRAGVDPASDVGKDVAGLLAGKSVSRDVYRAAEVKRNAMLADKGFVKRFFDGDQEAVRTMFLADAILSARVEEAA